MRIAKAGTNMARLVAIGIIAAMAGLLMYSGYGAFLNIEGLVIVVGGSIANAYLSYERRDVLKAFDTIRAMIRPSRETVHNPHLDIMQFIMWSYVLQQKDLIGLEKESGRKNHDALMRYGLDLVLTGYDAVSVRQMLHTVAEAEYERRCMPVTVLRNMAATAPAFGMVGTLVGMVLLLTHGGGDLTGIEGGLGVAMLSTLYGILVARLICLPAADKLLQREEKANMRQYLVCEGLALLAEKRRPFYVQDRLNSFLEPSRHIDFSSDMYSAMQKRHAMAA